MKSTASGLKLPLKRVWAGVSFPLRKRRKPRGNPLCGGTARRATGFPQFESCIFLILTGNAVSPYGGKAVRLFHCITSSPPSRAKITPQGKSRDIFHKLAALANLGEISRNRRRPSRGTAKVCKRETDKPQHGKNPAEPQNTLRVFKARHSPENGEAVRRTRRRVLLSAFRKNGRKKARPKYGTVK